MDVNSFYASCETIFRPDLRGQPVIVLSNNDGCVIARSAEAKALGVPMGAPYFKIKEEMRRRNVAVFSSNYALYADMSRRVMDTLEEMAPAVEIYSLDKSKLYSVVTQQWNPSYGHFKRLRGCTATLEHIHFVPHILERRESRVTYSVSSNRPSIKGFPQIFWAGKMPWREANLWAMERATAGKLPENRCQ